MAAAAASPMTFATIKIVCLQGMAREVTHAGMRIEQVVKEGDYEKGRLVGISGHWEDGAALMWETEMKRLELAPCDDPQWSKLTDSKGKRLQGTQKSIVGGIWLKWKIPMNVDEEQKGLKSDDKEIVAPGPLNNPHRNRRNSKKGARIARARRRRRDHSAGGGDSRSRSKGSSAKVWRTEGDGRRE